MLKVCYLRGGLAEDNSCLSHQLVALGSTDHQGHSEGTPGAGKTWNIVSVFPSLPCSAQEQELDCHWIVTPLQTPVAKPAASGLCGLEEGSPEHLWGGEGNENHGIIQAGKDL